MNGIINLNKQRTYKNILEIFGKKLRRSKKIPSKKSRFLPGTNRNDVTLLNLHNRKLTSQTFLSINSICKDAQEDVCKLTVA